MPFYSILMPLADISLTINEKIIEKSKPSPFGKGDKIVMDLEYRNGREIVAADIIIGSAAQPDAKQGFYELVETHISESLFVGKPVTIELYKLAVYGKEGHFNWHRDTTHGNNHHATVLVALNTEWKGRSLRLRHEGEAVDIDIHAESVERSSGKDEEEKDEDKDEKDEDEDKNYKGEDKKGEGEESNEEDVNESGDRDKFKKSEKDENENGDGDKSKKSVAEKASSLGFQIVAFYTDIEHKVENITDGTCIVQRLFPFSEPDASRDAI